jgi:hypothetical protein
MDPQFTNALRESNWRSRCRTLETHASNMAESCLPEFRELIACLSARFVQLPTPKTHDEFNARMTQRNCISAIIARIVHGNSIAKEKPRAKQEIYALARALAELPLGTPFPDVLSTCTAFSSQVNSICR